MIRFYKIKITKKPIGTAIEHIMPKLKGNIITNIYDITTDGDYRLFVVNCSDKENKANISLEGVTKLSEMDAAALAEQYQPARKIKILDPSTQKEKEIDIPKLDLKAYMV